MPCHAFTDKVLLLARGERVVSETQIERLSRSDVIFSNDPPPELAQAIEERQRALGIWIPPHQGAEDRAQNLRDSSPESPAQRPAEPRAPFVVEIVAARKLRREAMRQVADLVEQARAGQPLELHPVRQTVRQVVSSLHRNHRAFASLLQLETVDTYTYTHSINNCVLSVILTQHSGLDDQAEVIELGALMHDIGKVRLPESPLHKPGSLTEYEWSMVKQHPAIGLEIVRLRNSGQEAAADAIGQHHERLDGSGYPGGLGATAISLAGRIVAISDVHDAMTSDRPYHKAIQPSEAMRSILQQGRELFDPQLVRTFLNSIGLFPVGSLVRLSTGELAVVTDVNPVALRRPTVLMVPGLCGVPSGEARLINLAQPAASGAGKEIVCVEDPREFAIEVEEYLAMVPALAEKSWAGLDSLA